MAAADRLRAAQAALQNPNVQAFLDVIADAEGVNYGYNTLFGNEKIQSLEDHPRERRTFRETSGKRNTTTAAGRYQFLEKTWDDVAGKLGLQDFSPQSQDLAAVELLRRNGALDSLQQGDFAKAVQQSGSTWASLPSSPYAQPRRSSAFIDQALQRARGSAQPAAPIAGQAVDAAQLERMIAQLMGPAPASSSQAEGQAPPKDLLSQIKELTLAPPAAEEMAPAPQIEAPAWASQLQSMSQQASAATSLGEPAPEQADEWTQQLLASGLENMADEARGNAVASFLGEDPVRRVPLPPALEQAIMRAITSV